jgi:hypothetical protein
VFVDLFILFLSCYSLVVVYLHQSAYDSAFFNFIYFKNFSYPKLQTTFFTVYDVNTEQFNAFNSIFRRTRHLFRKRIYRKGVFDSREDPARFLMRDNNEGNIFVHYYKPYKPDFYVKTYKEVMKARYYRNRYELHPYIDLDTRDMRYRIFWDNWNLYYLPRLIYTQWRYRFVSFKLATGNVNRFNQLVDPTISNTFPSPNHLFFSDIWNFLLIQLKLYLSLETLLFFNFLSDLTFSTFITLANFAFFPGLLFFEIFFSFFFCLIFFLRFLFSDLTLVYNLFGPKGGGYTISKISLLFSSAFFFFINGIFIKFRFFVDRFYQFLNSIEFKRFKIFTRVSSEFLNLKLFDRFKKFPYAQSRIYSQRFPFSTVVYNPLISTYPGFESWDSMDYMMNPVDFNIYYSNFPFSFVSLPSTTVFRARPGIHKFKNKFNSFFINEYSFPFTYFEENFTRVNSYVSKYVFIITYGLIFPFLFFFEAARFIIIQGFLVVIKLNIGINGFVLYIKSHIFFLFYVCV